MTIPLETNISKIDNSHAIRPCKLLLLQVGLDHETEIETQDGQLGIHPEAVVRQGWEEAFGGMAMAGDDHLLDPEPMVLTKWETHEWEWYTNERQEVTLFTRVMGYFLCCSSL